MNIQKTFEHLDFVDLGCMPNFSLVKNGLTRLNGYVGRANGTRTNIARTDVTWTNLPK